MPLSICEDLNGDYGGNEVSKNGSLALELYKILRGYFKVVALQLDTGSFKVKTKYSAENLGPS